MRILVVSNLYPPHFVGGYELRCALVAEGLARAGHDVQVLTSLPPTGPAGPVVEDVAGVRVSRLLQQYYHGPRATPGRPYFLSVVRRQLQDAERFRGVLDEFRPDVVNWWSVGGLAKTILQLPPSRGIPDALFIEDDWIIEEEARGGLGQRPPWSQLWLGANKPWYWRPALTWLMERWKRRLAARGVETRAVPFRPRHACFVSEYLRAHYEEEGVRFASSEVIHGGVEVEKFLFRRPSPAGERERLRVLYAGQITRDRGLDTLVEAFALLAPEPRSATSLTIVGELADTDYHREVQERVRGLGLSEVATFEGKIEYARMPEVYRRHDLLVSPSLRREGLPLSMAEAMLSGCAVVTTGSGGAAEIARLAELPLFPKGDARALSRMLESFVENPRLLEDLARRGQEVALRELSVDLTVDRLAETLRRLCASSAERGARQAGVR